MSKEKFCQALHGNFLHELQGIAKSDLHSHAGRGGNISYIEKWANVKISPPSKPFNSLDEMNKWLNDYVKCHCPPGLPGYLKRVEAAFVQAQDDHIAVLALSFAADEIYAFGSVGTFVETMRSLHLTFAPETIFMPDLALGYDLHEPNMLDEILSANWFQGIDICNYAKRCTMHDLKAMCRKACDSHLILKAHVGEFDGADDVMRYAEELELDQIQHGIAAADSPQVMKWLADHRIQLNVCPTSNVMLKRSRNYKEHQIRRLFDHGVSVTINSDDLIIFQSSVSQEYLNLFNAGLMTAEELNVIRETGLVIKRNSSVVADGGEKKSIR